MNLLFFLLFYHSLCSPAPFNFGSAYFANIPLASALFFLGSSSTNSSKISYLYYTPIKFSEQIKYYKFTSCCFSENQTYSKNFPLKKFSFPNGFAVILNKTHPSGHITTLLYLLSPPTFNKSPPLLTASIIGYIIIITLEH